MYLHARIHPPARAPPTTLSIPLGSLVPRLITLCGRLGDCVFNPSRHQVLFTRFPADSWTQPNRRDRWAVGPAPESGQFGPEPDQSQPGPGSVERMSLGRGAVQ